MVASAKEIPTAMTHFRQRAKSMSLTKEPELNHRNRFQVLSLSGGGYRGVYSAAVLADLEESAGRPLAQCFDLIAGTSIGGIIGLGLALEKPMSSILGAFEKHGKRIFSDRPAPKGWFYKGVDL